MFLNLRAKVNTFCQSAKQNVIIACDNLKKLHLVGKKHDEIHQWNTKSAPLLGGADFFTMVGTIGLEPMTSSM